MRILGHTLLWAGFLAGAFVSLRHLESAGEGWATIRWDLYAVTIVVGIIGVVLLRIDNQKVEADDTKTDGQVSILRSRLARLIEVVDQLCRSDSLHPTQVRDSIDADCTGPLAEFAEARNALTRRYGLTVYADIMTEFASAERYINRSWSAAADGYVDEVAASLLRAKGHLAKAKILIDNADER
ncbi:hypothetical protein Q31b_43900 [Novipirellula aureliae]|uniref:Uncharacterized protein n=1 Tax=Novipirellula aureliae TaxID=2527966 RepID=A0A5C6DLV4_9BACT|nr:hypothetical protein [Novipirellula aureliae]TWU37602.1 hypothetical protein Q31b_43900 [Novipirellula aureliae]